MGNISKSERIFYQFVKESENKKMSFNKKNILFVVEIIIIFLFLGFYIISKNNADNYIISLDSMVSEYIAYNDGWKIAEGELSEESNVLLLKSQPISLEKGTYTLNAWYEEDDDQRIYYDAKEYNVVVEYGTPYLRKYDNEMHYDFEVTSNIPEFAINIDYNGEGAFNLQGLSISENQNGIKRNIIYTIIFFIIIDLVIIFYERIIANVLTYATVFLTWFITSIGVFAKECISGTDYHYHTLRIEALVKELDNKIFPIRIDSLFFGGAGYPSPIYYNDIFLYIPAFFRKMGFNISQSCNIFYMIINFVAVIIAFYSFKKIFESNRIAALTTIAYITTSYRFVVYYVTSAIGQFMATAFIPLIALFIWEMYVNTDKYDIKEVAIYIVLGMTGLIGCNVLATFIVIAALALVVVVRITTTLKKKVIVTWMLGIAGSLLLNAYYLVPFVSYYMTEKVNINTTVANDTKFIQNTGVSLFELFSFFNDPYRGLYANTLGPLLIGTFIVGLLLLFLNKLGKLEKFVLAFSFLGILIVTKYFPWNYIVLNTKFGYIFSQVQFVTRWMSVVAIWLTLLLGLILKNRSDDLKNLFHINETAVNYFIVILASIVCLYNFSLCANENNRMVIQDTDEMWVYDVGAAEYVREGTDVMQLPGKFNISGVKGYEIVNKRGSKIDLKIEGEGAVNVEVPLMNYSGYKAWDEQGNYYEIYDGENNRVSFDLPYNFNGTVHIAYIEPIYWTIALVVSIITAISIIILIILIKRKRKKSEVLN